MMNRLLIVLLLTICAGCVTTSSRKAVLALPRPIQSPHAIVIRVHHQYRFVVLDFSMRPMPPLGTLLDVYRGRQRIGVVRLSEPRRPLFTTADIVEGYPEYGDEAREQPPTGRN